MNRLLLAIGAIVVGLFVFSISTVQIHEAQRGIRFRLGEAVDTNLKPGLHWIMPGYNNIRTFDARAQTLDEDPQQFLTQQKKPLLVDAFVKWRIDNVETFYLAVQGRYTLANDRLSSILRNGLREEFRQRTIPQLVSGDRSQVMSILQKRLTEAGESLGVQVLDVRIKRIELSDQVSESVFDRMRAERNQVARELRALGQQKGEEIRSEADFQRRQIVANAEREAQIIKGNADAEAARTYAEAYSKDKDFYSFYRSLQAYRETFKDKSDRIVLSPNSDFFRYFDKAEPGAR
jgi:membrane protease subunit HflC